MFAAARRQADVVLILIKRGAACRSGDAAFSACHIGDHALGIHRWREERRGAVPPRAGFLAGFSAANANAIVDLHVLGRVVVDRLAGLLVDALGPGDFLLVLVGTQELTAVAVERVVVPVAR